MTGTYIILGIVYLWLGRHILGGNVTDREKWFARLNIGFLFLVFYFTYNYPYLRRNFLLHVLVAGGLTAAYVGAIVWQFKMLAKEKYALAFWAPIVALIIFKFMGAFADNGSDAAVWLKERVLLIGISYLSFKLSYSVLEIKNKVIALPSRDGYIGYSLYVPTLFVGPINSVAAQMGTPLPVPKTLETAMPHLLRIASGIVKITLLAGWVERLGYDALVTSAATTAPIDYFVAPAANLIFLYLNFAGACDIAIAGSALLGIFVKENFNYPFFARSVQDFWNRWHMTLSGYFKDVVFMPFTTWLTSKVGSRHVNHCIAVGILLTFLLIGAWHGTTTNFLLLGLIYGLAVVFNHYNSLAMKALLKKRYKAFHQHVVVKWISIIITFWFVSTVALLLNNDVATFFTCVKAMAGTMGLL